MDFTYRIRFTDDTYYKQKVRDLYEEPSDEYEETPYIEDATILDDYDIERLVEEKQLPINATIVALFDDGDTLFEIKVEEAMKHI